MQVEKPICGPLVGWNVIEEEQGKEMKMQREGVGYIDASRNMDCQLASRSVLKDFTGDELLFSSRNLFQRELREWCFHVVDGGYNVVAKGT